MKFKVHIISDKYEMWKLEWKATIKKEIKLSDFNVNSTTRCRIKRFNRKINLHTHKDDENSNDECSDMP